MAYKRILLKLSGEALMGAAGYGIDPETIGDVAEEMRDVREAGVELAVVIGGGNIYRGMRAEKQGIDRVTGDYMGMIATVMNSLAMKARLENLGLAVSIQSALPVGNVVEPFVRRKAVRRLKEGRILIFAGGTGNPFFTTDTAAALRAVEVDAEVMLKATKVDGVYDKDPEAHGDAVFFPEITYKEALRRGLAFMDATAISLCMENGLPIVVFNLRKKGNLKRVVHGERTGTIVRG